jgi:polysaccharide pyruvyl transferase WcaK-like protein
MDLVITSRLHGGITAMSAGSPVLFLAPGGDVKVLDVLSSVGLDANDFMIDLFDAKQLRLENLVSRVKVLLDDTDSYQKMVRMSVDAALPQVELPVRALAQLMG